MKLLFFVFIALAVFLFWQHRQEQTAFEDIVVEAERRAEIKSRPRVSPFDQALYDLKLENYAGIERAYLHVFDAIAPDFPEEDRAFFVIVRDPVWGVGLDPDIPDAVLWRQRLHALDTAARFFSELPSASPEHIEKLDRLREWARSTLERGVKL